MAIAIPSLQTYDIPFSSVPGQSRLFLEYLHDPTGLNRYYPNALVSPDQAGDLAPAVLDRYETDRRALADSLFEINSRAGASEETLRNIELLRRGDTVAVVTGQQAGLFTGPLFTIYKALTAIKLAANLSEKGTPAVPVFWAATEDHDFEEVSAAYFLDREGEVRRVEYENPDGREGIPVGDVVIDAEIERVLEAASTSLASGDFLDEVKAILSDSWRPGMRYGEAFIRTLARLFGKYGLVMFDPQAEGIKALSSCIYSKIIENADEIVSSIRQRDLALAKDGFHSQVLVEADHFPIFWIDEQGRRVSLRRIADGRYRVRKGDREFTSGELIEMARQTPERLSPGVMVRPVVQDALLPTVAYVGGAAEIAYFAQNSEAYRILERPVTPIIHRQSLTIVETAWERILKKLGLALTDLFGSEDEVEMKIAEMRVDPATGRLFADVEEEINQQMNRLDQAVAKIDVTVAESLAKRRQKIIYHIAAIRKKTLLAQARRHDLADRRLARLRNSLVPNGALQERSINVFTFLNKYGTGFIDRIYDAVDVGSKGHRIVTL